MLRSEIIEELTRHERRLVMRMPKAMNTFIEKQINEMGITKSEYVRMLILQEMRDTQIASVRASV